MIGGVLSEKNSNMPINSSGDRCFHIKQSLPPNHVAQTRTIVLKNSLIGDDLCVINDSLFLDIDYYFSNLDE